MRKVLVALVILLLLGGTTVLVYPHVQQVLYTRYARGLIEDFQARLEVYREQSELLNPDGGNPGDYAQYPGGYPGSDGGSGNPGSGSGGYSGGSGGYPGSGSGYPGGYPGGNSGYPGNSGYTGDPPGNGYGEEEQPLHWLYLRMAAHNRELFEGGQQGLRAEAFYEEEGFTLQRFGMADDMIGYISVPRMDIELPVFLGATHENLRRGAAHMTHTSLPIGGIDTNSVITAHRGMSTAAMFRDIDHLEVGDDVFVTNFHGTLHYRVIGMQIIWPDEVNSILIQPGRDLLTLLTCHPRRQEIQRYLVFAERVI